MINVLYMEKPYAPEHLVSYMAFEVNDSTCIRCQFRNGTVIMCTYNTNEIKTYYFDFIKNSSPGVIETCVRTLHIATLSLLDNTTQ